MAAITILESVHDGSWVRWLRVGRPYFTVIPAFAGMTIENGMTTERNADYAAPVSATNSSSVSVVTPSAFAFSAFDPASAPTTT